MARRVAPGHQEQEGIFIMAYQPPEIERLLTPAEVAAMFRVEGKTVTRWAVAGKLSSIRTLGGHRRFPEAEVLALLRGETTRAAVADAGGEQATQAKSLGFIAKLHCGDEIVIEERQEPGAKYECEHHGFQLARTITEVKLGGTQ